MKATASARDFRPETIGEMQLAKGRQSMALRLTSLASGSAMSLRAIALAPVC